MRNPRLLHSIALVGVLALPTSQAVRAATPPSDAFQDEAWLRDATLDQLIDHLPTHAGQVDVRRRAPDGEVIAQPVADELGQRILNGALLTDDQWRRALLGSEAVRYRARWPQDRPFAMAINQPTWLHAARIRFEPRERGLQTVVGGALTMGCLLTPHRRTRQELGLLTSVAHHSQFNVAVSTQEFGIHSEPIVHWTGEWTIAVETVQTVDEILRPTEDPLITSALRRALRLTCAGHEDEEHGLHVPVLIIDPLPADRALFDDLALSLRLDLLRDGETKATYQLNPRCPRTGKTDPWLEIGLGGAILDELQPCLHATGVEPQRWTLVLTGTDRTVLTNWEAQSYWTGSLTIPVLEARDQERERPDADAIGIFWFHWFTRT